MSAKKVLGWIALLFALFWIIAAPHAAADLVEDVAGALRTAAENLVTFFSDLAD